MNLSDTFKPEDILERRADFPGAAALVEIMFSSYNSALKAMSSADQAKAVARLHSQNNHTSLADNLDREARDQLNILQSSGFALEAAGKDERAKESGGKEKTGA